jgi:hypothetical protein
MEGASKRTTPLSFQKRNPGDEAEAAISQKRPPEETSDVTPATAINAPPAPTFDEPRIRRTRSPAPTIRELRKRRAQSPADGLSDFVDLYRSARNDDEAGTQRHIDSGGNWSNTRNGIFTLTQNSTPDATPNESNAGDLSDESSNDDNSSSTNASQIHLRIHRRASNRKCREMT